MVPTAIISDASTREIQQYYHPLPAIAPDEPKLVHYAKGWATGAPDVLVFEQSDSTTGQPIFSLRLLDARLADRAIAELHLHAQLNFADAFNLAQLFAGGQLRVAVPDERPEVASGTERYPYLDWRA